MVRLTILSDYQYVAVLVAPSEPVLAGDIELAEAEDIEGRMWLRSMRLVAAGQAMSRTVACIGELPTLTLAADAMVWAPQGVVSIVGLRSGFELRGGRPGHTTLVHSASVLPARELNVVRLHLGSGSRSAGSVTMTCLHTVMGKKPGQRNRSDLTTLAKDTRFTQPYNQSSIVIDCATCFIRTSYVYHLCSCNTDRLKMQQTG